LAISVQHRRAKDEATHGVREDNLENYYLRNTQVQNNKKKRTEFAMRVPLVTAAWQSCFWFILLSQPKVNVSMWRKTRSLHCGVYSKSQKGLQMRINEINKAST
jgi:hypothetical protein